MSLIGPEGSKQLKLAARFASVGFELVVAILVGYFGGRWLDVTYQTGPVLQYLGLLLGIFAGFRGLYMLSRDAQASAEDDFQSDSSPGELPRDEQDPPAKP